MELVFFIVLRCPVVEGDGEVFKAGFRRATHRTRPLMAEYFFARRPAIPSRAFSAAAGVAAV
jgi:hypothetical protein